MTTTPTIQLSEEQEKAVETIQHWLDEENMSEFRLGGYAGTGKTTVIKFLLASLTKCPTIVSAFTGKAVNVLQRKGVRAQTLHSLLYNVEILKGGQVLFTKRGKLETDPDLIIVDEASMISTELYNDLKSFGKKLLFVGDPGQLEPVGDNPDLMRTCDLVLNTIHRQAAESPIIKLANEIRLGKSVPIIGTNAEGLVIRDKKLTPSLLDGFDQVICAKNDTRAFLNEKYRAFKQYPTYSINHGEKLIVLKNNQNFGIFNGQLMWLEEVTDDKNLEYWECTLKDEQGGLHHEIPVWRKPFTEPANFIKPRQDHVLPRRKDKAQCVLMGFGYAITCHKSQGSEWDHVLLWDEWMPPHIWDMKRWRYTGITRAAKHLTYCL